MSLVSSANDVPGAKHTNTYLQWKSTEYPGLQKNNIRDALDTDFSEKSAFNISVKLWILYFHMTEKEPVLTALACKTAAGV